MKKLSRQSWLLVATSVVAVGVVAAITLFVVRPQANQAAPGITDSQTIQDLIMLEKAALGQGRTLPQGLNQVPIGGLQGKETDYWYQVVQQPSTDYNPRGNAGGIFNLCAVFHTRAGLDEPSFDYGITYNSPEGYRYHQQGMQCYEVSDSRHYNAITVKVLKDIPSWVGK
jgi:hypothetical protein